MLPHCCQWIMATILISTFNMQRAYYWLFGGLRVAVSDMCVSVCKMHPEAPGGGLLWDSWQHCPMMVPGTSWDKVLLPLICNFGHQETEIIRVRYFLKSNCLIVWGIGCLVWRFPGGEEGQRSAAQSHKSFTIVKNEAGTEHIHFC